MVASSAEGIIRVAEQRLEIAKFALKAMQTDPRSFQSALRNVAVFGAAVTTALQDLHSAAYGLDARYSRIEEKMRTELVEFFDDLRTEFGKKLTHPATAMPVNCFIDQDTFHFLPHPPRAVSFFADDKKRTTAWTIKDANESDEMYLIEFPTDIHDIAVQFKNAPPHLTELSVAELCERYVAELGAVIDETKNYFVVHAR